MLAGTALSEEQRRQIRPCRGPLAARSRPLYGSGAKHSPLSRRLGNPGVPVQIRTQTVRLLIFMHSKGHSGHRERLRVVELFPLIIFIEVSRSGTSIWWWYFGFEVQLSMLQILIYSSMSMFHVVIA